MSAPSWTSEVMSAKQGLIKARAYQHWRRWEGVLDRSFLEDLEQEAWEAAFAHSPDEPHLAQKIDDACRAYIRYWRLGLRGLSNTTAPRTITQQVPMAHGAVKKAQLRVRQALLPEPAAELHEVLQAILDQCTERMAQVWWAQLLEGSLYLKRRDQRRLHLSAGEVRWARNRLQRVASHVMRGERYGHITGAV